MTIWPKIWLILGPNQPQTRLRAQNLTISTQFSRENREEKRGCCREKRKGKQTGCERQTVLSPSGSYETARVRMRHGHVEPELEDLNLQNPFRAKPRPSPKVQWE